MPRFEMYLMLAQKKEGNIETSEYEIVCWVDDSSNLRVIQSVANEVINDHIERAENLLLFGTASVRVKGNEVLTIGFRNSEADSEEIDEAIDLFGLHEGETIH